MTTLLENPVPILVVGAFVEVVLGIILWWTGRGVFFLAMIGVLLVVLAGVGLEWLIVTDRERIRVTLADAATALESNPTGDDRAGMLDRYIAKSARETRALVILALDRVEFTELKITDMEIAIDRDTSPPSAEVELIGFVSVKDRKAQWPYERNLLELTIELRRVEAKRWLVGDVTVRAIKGVLAPSQDARSAQR